MQDSQHPQKNQTFCGSRLTSVLQQLLLISITIKASKCQGAAPDML